MPLSVDSLIAKFTAAASSKYYFFDIADYAVKGALASREGDSFTVHKLFVKEGFEKFEAFRQLVRPLTDPKKNEWVQSSCGIYPKNRFMYKTVLENPAKSREAGFFQNLLKDKFKLDLNKHSVAVLNGNDGNDYGLGIPIKDVLFVGASSEDINSQQDQIAATGIYPESLECSSFAAVGGCVHYLKHKNLLEPTLLLEVRANDLQAIVLKNGLIDFLKAIPYGYDYFATNAPKAEAPAGAAKSLTVPSASAALPLGGSPLTLALIKDLSALISLYELDSNTSLKHLLVLEPAPMVKGLGESISKELKLQLVNIELPAWLEVCKVKLHPDINLNSVSKMYLNLFALMSSFKS